MYKYLCSDSDPLWKEYRKKLVTATAVPVIMELSPYQTREELLVHVLAGSPEPDFSDDSKRRMWWGSFCQESNRKAFEAITGLCTHPSNDLYASVKHPWLAATLDGWVSFPHNEDGTEYKPKASANPPLGGLSRTPYYQRFFDMLELCEDMVGVLEMKQTDRVGEWSDKVPEYYWAQVQCQMCVMDLTWGVCCAKIGASDMRFHVVERDNTFIEGMLEETRKFAIEAGIYNE